MNILWDFDGTLFDTYPAFTEAMYLLLDGKVDKHTILKELKISFSNATKVFQLTENEILKFKEIELSLSPSLKPPFPYVEDVLKRSGCNVIMTHKPKQEVHTILDYYDFHQYFQGIVAGDDGFPRKPHAASYQFLHDRHYLDLAVGDRELDILPAKEIGLRTCLFQNDTAGADFYVKSYRDFYDIIK
ncbi:HAD hydrolase-like protein [Metabacillus herbersteinensis]|uniref:HAD hydrolase-like protein n=1 Tax=Metabacillus herbersteinensis TaxID=283816 RepID=A0ABV6GAJ5_9BACI